MVNIARQNLKCYEILDRIVKAGCRVVDIEISAKFFHELNWLVAYGVIFKCDHDPSKGFNRYYLSYSAEVYRLVTTQRSTERGLARYTNLEIQKVVSCQDFPHPPKVILSSQGATP